MEEYPRRVVGGDLPALTRVWLRFLPRPVQALRSLRTELQQGKTAWIWSSSDPMSRRAQALPIRRLSLAS